MSENTPKKVSGKKYKPNIIDFLIVILFLGAVIGLVLRMGVVEKITLNTNEQQARISFLVEDISSSSYKFFKSGDDFYSKNHGCYVGKLESAGSMPAEKLVPSLSGDMIASSSPAMNKEDPNSDSYRVDVRGNILGSGVFSDEGFLLNGITYIAPGSEFVMESTSLTVNVIITDIQPATN